jgi:methionine biosynthesis protein MetW
MSKPVREYYDRYWSEEGFYPKGETRPDFGWLFERHISPDSRVLDIGCGDGGTAGVWAAKEGCAYVGVDVSANAVRDARARGLDARLIEDAAALPFEDDDFDAVVCIDVLEHLFDPLAAVRESARVLAPGGVAIYATPNIAYWRRRLELAAFGRWNPFGDERSVEEPWRDPHIRFFTERTLQLMLSAAGFTEIWVGGYHGALLADIPIVRRLARRRSSAAYRTAENRLPSLLALHLLAVARV